MAELTSYIDMKEREMLSFLEQIVNVDSGTHDKVGVDRVGALLSDRLGSLGFSVERVPQVDYGDHIVARKAGTGSKRILLVGHMDTVFSSGTVSARPFRVENGKAYGPGVVDMKGGLVSLVYALEALQETAEPSYREMDIVVVFNSDEEVLSPTSRPVITAEAKLAHTACIFEPARPGGEYVISRKGVGKYQLTVLGRSAHAGSQPDRGRNAIAEMAHKIVAIHKLSNSAAGTTVSVNVVRGGERANVIAERAYAEIDLRVPSLDEASRIDGLIRQIAAGSTIPEVTAELTGGILFPPMARTAGTEKLLAAVQAAGQQLGLDLRGVGTGGGSDGNDTSQFTPTIDGMGPRGGEAHSEREYMEVQSLAERTKVTALFLDSWPATAATLGQ